MRRKVTLSLDEEFIKAIDEERGNVPRSRYIEEIGPAREPEIREASRHGPVLGKMDTKRTVTISRADAFRRATQ